MTTFGWLILLFPLVGTVMIALGARFLRGRAAGWIGTGAIALSFLAATLALVEMLGKPADDRSAVSALWTLVDTAGIHIDVNILVDPLSLWMCLVITGVSTLIHLYSVGYMTSDAGYARYFSYLNFFVFSMLLLVLAANFVLLIVGWALVGFASYALISFWYRRKIAVDAGRKAFVINVAGDVAMMIAVFMLFRKIGSFDFDTVFAQAPGLFDSNSTLIVAICLLLLVGACAKSAQLPLQTWLPDAMEGPTPVSSLIHAATMVTAGVYLIARSHVLFELAPTAQWTAAAIGAATLLWAGLVALTQTDIKRTIAYSTISQIGYMVMAVSVAAFGAGFFHLMTHAFFKALLFMAAGSVMSAMAQELNIDRMSGFRKALPLTFGCFLAGGLALSAFPLTSGFFSKEDVLDNVLAQGGAHVILYVVGLIGAFVTVLYTFRLVYRVFFGEPCREARAIEEGGMYHPDKVFNPMTGESEDHEVGYPGAKHWIAERSRPMAFAMVVLAILSLGAGFLQVPGLYEPITHFLDPAFEGQPRPAKIPSESGALVGLLIGGVVSLLGLAVATRLWYRDRRIPEALRRRFHRLYSFFYNKTYFDELYAAIVVRPLLFIGRFCRQIFERAVVQGVIVGGSASAVRSASVAVRVLQSGYLRAYAMLLMVGLGGLILYFLVAG